MPLPIVFLRTYTLTTFEELDCRRSNNTPIRAFSCSQPLVADAIAVAFLLVI